MAELALRLDPLGGYVQLFCPDAAGASEIGGLSARYPSGERVALGLARVETDDFLTHLENLQAWPWPNEVKWDLTLRELVRTTFEDARQASAWLSGDGEALSPDDVLRLLGAKWRAPLTAFQLADLSRLLALRHGANFSVPGAGKTRVALAVMSYRMDRGDIERALVIAPKSAFEAWQEEAETAFGPGGLGIGTWRGGAPPAVDLLLTNYERLGDGVGVLESWLTARPTMLILDEAHRMKRGQAGVYGSACLRLGPHAQCRLVLTGTPAPNGASDLESIMGFVWPGAGRARVRAAVAGGDLRSASAQLRPLFVRTRKSDLGLPPITIALRPVELPPLHEEIYGALVGSAASVGTKGRADLESLGRIVMYLLMAAVSPSFLVAGATRYEPVVYRVPPLDPPPGSPLTELLEALPDYGVSPKLAEAEALVRLNHQAGRKTLVWSTFVRTLKTLEVMLADLNPAVVHGGTRDRDEQLAKFRNDVSCAVLLTNPATLGEGVSLHHCCHDAVYVDRDFAAGKYLQSIDRIHRLGLAPDESTSVTILAATGTIDEIVDLRLGSKVRFMEQVLDDADLLELVDLDEEPSVAGGLDPSDLGALLMHLRDASA